MLGDLREENGRSCACRRCCGWDSRAPKKLRMLKRAARLGGFCSLLLAFARLAGGIFRSEPDEIKGTKGQKAQKGRCARGRAVRLALARISGGRGKHQIPS